MRMCLKTNIFDTKIFPYLLIIVLLRKDKESQVGALDSGTLNQNSWIYCFRLYTLGKVYFSLFNDVCFFQISFLHMTISVTMQDFDPKTMCVIVTFSMGEACLRILI